jgi:hypothetical protein
METSDEPMIIEQHNDQVMTEESSFVADHSSLSKSSDALQHYCCLPAINEVYQIAKKYLDEGKLKANLASMDRVDKMQFVDMIAGWSDERSYQLVMYGLILRGIVDQQAIFVDLMETLGDSLDAALVIDLLASLVPDNEGMSDPFYGRLIAVYKSYAIGD